MPIVTRGDSTTSGAQRALTNIHKKLHAGLTRLATGHRINQAIDDAAGLGISENLRAQMRSFNQARRNAHDGLSVVQTAEGAMGQSAETLVRMRELAMQAANGALDDNQRAAIQQEYQQLQGELDRQAATTEYNGQALLDGSLTATSGGLTFQVGTHDSPDDRLQVTIEATDTGGLGVDSTAVDTASGATAALAQIDAAIDRVSEQRSDLGAIAQRFESVATNLAVAAENTAAANSRIRDADVAAETSRLAGQQMVQQAAAAVLAQANAQSAIVLNLLGD